MPREFIEADALRQAAARHGWGPVDVLAATGSTNADLAAAARAGLAPGAVLIASHQSAGRGRLARTWEAPPDTSVACSVLVRPDHPADEWGWLPLLTGMGVVDGIRDATGLDARLKWPNDVLVDQRKLCGILCERVETATGACAVLGFGINLTLTRDQLPVPTATSLLLEGSSVSATIVLASVLGHLAARIAAWNRGDDPREAYRSRCDTLGRDVEVHTMDGVRAGRAIDVDPAGGLVVEHGDVTATHLAGDVIHLRRS